MEKMGLDDFASIGNDRGGVWQTKLLGRYRLPRSEVAKMADDIKVFLVRRTRRNRFDQGEAVTIW